MYAAHAVPTHHAEAQAHDLEHGHVAQHEARVLVQVRPHGEGGRAVVGAAHRGLRHEQVVLQGVRRGGIGWMGGWVGGRM